MYSIVYTTISNKEDAGQLSEELLKRELVACVNFHEMESMYRWKGIIESGEEIGMILKTKEELVAELIDVIEEIHPYETPCAISFDVEKGSQGYLDWIGDMTK